ncbi:hypothetical protein ACLOJK_035891 [Asimina triloba]
MAGLGKTTLVSKVFRDSTVRRNFECFACVSVSQNLRITDLLESMIKQLEIDINMATTRAEDLRLSIIAEERLTELINRNMLQVAKVNPFGRVKACWMHDRMREVAISFSCEEFSITCDRVTGQLYKFRCISIYDYGEITQSADGGYQLISPSFSYRFQQQEHRKMASGFRSLRVLGLKGAQIERLPVELVELSNLRYLSLSETGISELPKSFKKLRNLSTSDLRETKLESLPNGIGELKNLRHVFRYKRIDSEYGSFHSWRSSKFPAQLCDITNLQSLGIIEADQGEEIAGQIGKLTQLRRLELMEINRVRPLEDTLSFSSAASKASKVGTGGAFGKGASMAWLSYQPYQPGVVLVPVDGRRRGTFAFHAPTAVQSSNALSSQGLRWARAGLRPVKPAEDKRGAMPSLQVLNLARCGEPKEIRRGIEHSATLQELCPEEMPTQLVDNLRGPTPCCQTCMDFQRRAVER